MSHLKSAPRWVQRAFWLILLLIIWQASVKLLNVSPLLFPPVELVAKTLWESLIQGDLLYQTAYSLGIIVTSIAISSTMAGLFALASVKWPTAASFFDTLTAVMHPLPGLALLPLIIIWFGTGSGAVLVILVHASVWPILLNITAGIAAVPQMYLDCGRNLGMKKAAVAWRILLPGSAGYIISGIKIGFARAWRSLISAEMVFGAVGAKGGIGWYILKQRTFMNTAGLFAGIFIVILLGILIEDILFAFIERHTVEKWGYAKARDDG